MLLNFVHCFPVIKMLLSCNLVKMFDVIEELKMFLMRFPCALLLFLQTKLMCATPRARVPLHQRIK